MSVAALVGMIAKGKGAKFASITYTAKGTGETARHLMILGASVETLYTKDIAALEAMLAGDTLSPVEREAATELLASRQESLTKGIGNNSAYTCADTYVHVDGVAGVKVHKDTGVLYVTGLSQSKTVLVPGTYKAVKSAPKTIAKRNIEKGLASGRFRQMILKNVTRAALNGDVLEIEAE